MPEFFQFLDRIVQWFVFPLFGWLYMQDREMQREKERAARNEGQVLRILTMLEERNVLRMEDQKHLEQMLDQLNKNVEELRQEIRQLRVSK